MKTLLYFFIIFVLFVCIACNPYPTSSTQIDSLISSTPSSTEVTESTVPESVTSIRSTNTPIPTVTITPSSTPQSSKLPTQELSATSSATVMIVPTSTPLPPLVWIKGVSDVIELGDYQEYWSPTKNEILLVICKGIETDREADLLFWAEAPYFELIQITPDTFFCGSSRQPVVWTPDGKQIAFNGLSFEIGEEPSEYASYFPDSSELWLMSSSGDNPHHISPNFGDSPNRNLTFVGWMGDQTVAYSGYTGGGSYQVTILDISTGEYVTWYEVTGRMHKPNAKYVPVSLHYPELITKALPKTNLAIDKMNYFNALDIKKYPKLDLPLGRYSIEFEGWLPSTNKMLLRVSVFENGDENLPTYKLILWDVDTNEVVTQVDSFGGRFSSDGSLLAYLTFNKSHSYPNKNEPIPLKMYAELPRYLHILDVETKQNIFSSSIVSNYGTNFSDQSFGVTFSPNSHYVSFFDSASSSEGSPENENKNLNIFDTGIGEIVYRIPASMRLPLWSPNGERLAYFDEQNNFVILTIPEMKITKLTESGGQRIMNLQWSFDGQYLSFHILGQLAIARVVE